MATLSVEETAKVQSFLKRTSHFERVLPIALCGPSGAGKLTILRRHCTGVVDYDDDPWEPADRNSWLVTENLWGSRFVGHWTTHREPPFVGEEELDRDMLRKHLEEVKACVMVYDVGSMDSFLQLRRMYDLITMEILPRPENDMAKVKLVVLANKIDLVPGVAEGATTPVLTAGREFAQSISCVHDEQSARDENANLYRVFFEISSRVVLDWVEREEQENRSKDHDVKQERSEECESVVKWVVWPSDGNDGNLTAAVRRHLETLADDVHESGTKSLGINYWTLSLSEDQAQELRKFEGVCSMYRQQKNPQSYWT